MAKRQEPGRPLSWYAAALRALWAEIHDWRPPLHRRDFGVYTEKRALTVLEWGLVLEAVKAGLPATMVSHGWMGGVALVVYEPAPTIYPGVSEDADPVLQVTAAQVPGNDPRKSPADQPIDVSVERPTPGGVWAIFSEVCGTPENLERLDREKIGRPKPIGHYQY